MKAVVAVVAALVALGVLFYVYTSPTPPPEMTEAEVAQIEAEAKQAIADQWDGFTVALQDVDYEGWRSYWTSGARVLQPGSDLSGSDLFDYVRDLFASGIQFTAFDVQSSEIFVHGDVAYQIGQYDETVQMPEEEPTDYHDSFFARWVKEDGSWRIDRFLGGPRDAPAEG